MSLQHGVSAIAEPPAPTSATDVPRLTIDHAVLRYGTLEVLADVNLDVGATEIVSIVGPSGCGKTTLLRCVGGLTQLDSGEIRIDGHLVERPLPSVSMVFQHFGLFPWKSLWNNIAYGLKLRRDPKDEIQRRVAEAIGLVGLSGFENAYPHQLSGAVQQRAGLARALVMEPRLLLMDEPFSAIDAQMREQLQFELLRIWDRRPTAMMFVTHAIDEAVLMGDRVVVLAGRPSHVRAVRHVDLPRPRDRSVVSTQKFINLREQVWHDLFDKQAADELDYADMVVLAETFVSWALDEPDIAPHHRTMLIEAGVDYEKLAAWVGPGWKASDPSDRPNPLRAIAELVSQPDGSTL